VRHHQIMGLDRTGCIDYDGILSNTLSDSNPFHAEVLIVTGSSFRAQGRHRLLQDVPIEQPG